jgi:hypothetical protein
LTLEHNGRETENRSRRCRLGCGRAHESADRKARCRKRQTRTNPCRTDSASSRPSKCFRARGHRFLSGCRADTLRHRAARPSASTSLRTQRSRVFERRGANDKTFR